MFRLQVTTNNMGSHTVSTEHVMSMYWNVCLMMVTVTETRSKRYIIEYIVVFLSERLFT